MSCCLTFDALFNHVQHDVTVLKIIGSASAGSKLSNESLSHVDRWAAIPILELDVGITHCQGTHEEIILGLTCSQY